MCHECEREMSGPKDMKVFTCLKNSLILPFLIVDLEVIPSSLATL